MTSVLFDFSDPRSVALWNPINDRVMGGVSHSQLRNDPAGHALFCGHVSFENNGGFASVRCQPGDFGKKEVIAYLLEVCGDGKRYKLNLRTDEGFDGVVYQVGFIPPTGQWATCRLASADFLPSWRGRPVPDAAPLDTSCVRQIGLMIADRQAGPFGLAVRSIATESA
ncbi:MAG: CIA30 family protein [Candidatus Accumulibacter phosphatis]|jgi:NADH dehydrogenase [ubiquinone] 1 alpha subcomplex assembly factor 1|uniref:CIA30 family protein n=1 Tax=Candidatus Accumulibacter contiguus TaxID=2954381 RepID=A0ABX1TB18_9PROT|nr:CIA30 family protein [Candidatus Accumulibacter contiguus]MBL8407376.1 CIA30 family protein [Accumulibacter sp.]NMQ05760.1 CIA30 family protein [Candidatus Accumulibacter contiguus]